MSQVVRIKLESQMIVRMDHLMCHGILHMTAIPELVCAQQNAVVGVKATTLSRRAASTAHIGGVQIVAEQVDVVPHEANDGRVLQKPCFVAFAARTIALLVQVVLDFEVCLSFLVLGGSA